MKPKYAFPILAGLMIGIVFTWRSSAIKVGATRQDLIKKYDFGFLTGDTVTVRLATGCDMKGNSLYTYYRLCFVNDTLQSVQTVK